MAMYWLYKYKIEDRGVAVLDLLSLEEAKDVDFPVPTICLEHPFKEKVLKEKHSISSKKYLNYLAGVCFEDSMKKIDFKDVTLDLGDYFIGATEKWKNDTDTFIESSIDVVHETTFSGFNVKNRFVKCFSIQMDVSHHRYIKSIGLHYDRTKLMADWNTIEEDHSSGPLNDQFESDTNDEYNLNAVEEDDFTGPLNDQFENNTDVEYDMNAVEEDYSRGTFDVQFENNTNEEYDLNAVEEDDLTVPLNDQFEGNTNDEYDGNGSQEHQYDNDCNEKYEKNDNLYLQFGIKLHKQGQFLIGDEPVFKPDYLINSMSHSNEFWIQDFEIIRRRNTNDHRCLQNETTYDQVILKKHLLQKRCRPPYLNVDDSFPLCNSYVEMDFAKLTYGKTKTIDYLKPCSRISKLNLKHEPIDPNNDHRTNNTRWDVYINFPEDVKTIVQFKEIDIHSLIGNLGGYLGLLTGYAVIQIPTLLISIHKLFSK